MLQLLEKEPYYKELLEIFKKLVLLSAISVPVIDGDEEVVKVSYIHYPI